MLSVDPRAFIDEPSEGRSRETAIRRDAAGRWWNDDLAITHPNVTAAFDGWIRRAEDGRFCLANDINWAYVNIEGAPYTVRHIALGEAIRVQLSGGLEEPLDASTLRVDASGHLYCDVLDGTLAAVFSGAAMNELADAFEDDGRVLRLLGARWTLPTVADPLAPHREAKSRVVDAPHS